MAKIGMRWKIVAGFSAIYVLWGSTYLAIRFAVETIPPFLAAGTRHLIAGIVLFAFVRRKSSARITGRQWRGAAVVGALMLLGGNGLVTYAEKTVPSGLAALIVASVPLWMMLLSALEHRRPPRIAVAAGLALGFSGLALLLAPGLSGSASHASPLGAAALLVAALCWSIGSLYSRRAGLPTSVLLSTAMQMICGGTILWVAGSAFGELAGFHPSAISARSAISLGYLIVFGSLAGFTAYTWLLQVSSPARVSTYAFVNPVVAVFLGWMFAGETLSLRSLIAAALIVGAVGFVLKFGAERKAEPRKNASGEQAAGAFGQR